MEVNLKYVSNQIYLTNKSFALGNKPAAWNKNDFHVPRLQLNSGKI